MLFSKFASLIVRSTDNEVDFQEYFDFFSAVVDINKKVSAPAVTRNSTSCLLLAELLASRFEEERRVYDTIVIRLSALCTIRALHLKNTMHSKNLTETLYQDFRQRISIAIQEIIRYMAGRERYYLEGQFYKMEFK